MRCIPQDPIEMPVHRRFEYPSRNKPDTKWADIVCVCPLNLYAKENGEDVFVGIFAEGEKDFLVRVGKFTRKRNDYGTDGTTFTYEQSFEDYVLIRKEDYWNSRPNYLRFKYYE